MDLAYTGPVTISSAATVNNLWMLPTTDLILSPGAVLNVTGTANISGSLTLRSNSRFYISGHLLNATAMMCAHCSFLLAYVLSGRLAGTSGSRVARFSQLTASSSQYDTPNSSFRIGINVTLTHAITHQHSLHPY